MAKPTESAVKKSINWKEVGVITIFWYIFNISYNVYNQYCKGPIPSPWINGTIQLGVGMIYAGPLFALGFRKLPNLKLSDLGLLAPIVALNSIGHMASVIAMFEKGGGSLTHVIKASEPVVVVLLNLLVNKVVPKPLTALSLVPIVYGVAYAATNGNLDPATMTRDLTTTGAK